MFQKWLFVGIVFCAAVLIKSQLMQGSEQSQLLPISPNCGATLTDRIYHGTKTELDEYPWMALLEYRLENGTLQFGCGGFLINRRYVLTAAHCVTGVIVKELGELVSVRLGEHDISKQEDCEECESCEECGNCERCSTTCEDVYCSDDPQNIPVEEFVFHPDFTQRKKHHDIAVVRLSKEAVLGDSVKLICLPQPMTPEPIAGSNLTIAGWGYTENHTKSNIKLKVEVQVVSDSHCKDKNRGYRFNFDGQFCAEGEDHKDSCLGDSGGPTMGVVNVYWYAHGIVSFGQECGTAPAVYTRTSYYMHWITEQLRA